MLILFICCCSRRHRLSSAAFETHTTALHVKYFSRRRSLCGCIARSRDDPSSSWRTWRLQSLASKLRLQDVSSKGRRSWRSAPFSSRPGGTGKRCAPRVPTVSLDFFPFLHLTLNSNQQDIPTLTAEAAANHPGVGYFVAAPLGLHPLMTTIVDSRLETCLAHLTAGGTFVFVGGAHASYPTTRVRF